MTEKQLLEGVRAMARLLGWLVYHTHRSDRSEPGFPDLVLVRPPRVVFVELKVGKNQLSPEQQLWMNELGRSSDVESYVWREEHLLNDTIDAKLR